MSSFTFPLRPPPPRPVPRAPASRRWYRVGHQVCARASDVIQLPLHRPPRLRSTHPAPQLLRSVDPVDPNAPPGPQSPPHPPVGLSHPPTPPPKVLVFSPSQVPKMEAEGEEEDREREKKKSCGLFRSVGLSPTSRPSRHRFSTTEGRSIKLFHKTEKTTAPRHEHFRHPGSFRRPGLA